MRWALLAFLLLAAVPVLGDIPPGFPMCEEKTVGEPCTTHTGNPGVCTEQTSTPAPGATAELVCEEPFDAAPAAIGFRSPVAVAIALTAFGLAVGLFVKFRRTGR